MRVPVIVIPATVVAFAALCVPLREVFIYPAASVSFGDAAAVEAAQIRQVEMVVQGVKCKGTAEFFVKRYEGKDGILDMQAFAADHEVVVTYDASKIDADAIRAIGEAPVLLRDGELRTFFVVEEMREP